MYDFKDKPPPSPQNDSKQLSPDYVLMVSPSGYVVKVYKCDPEIYKKHFEGPPSSWKRDTIGYFKARIYVDSSASKGLPTWAKVAIGVGDAGVLAGGAALAAPAVLAGAGFAGTGVVGGSLAAAWQATIGNVVAGSLFASFQAAGMAGLGAAGLGAAAAAGAAFGGITGGIIANGVRIKIPVLKIQEAFDKYDLAQGGYVLGFFLNDILKDLGIKLSEKELKVKFKKATGCEFEDSLFIFYEEFLSFFGLKIYKDEELCCILDIFFVRVVKENGRIVPDDIKQMLKVVNVNVSEEQVEACFEHILGDHTEYINFRQFLKLFGISLNEKN